MVIQQFIHSNGNYIPSIPGGFSYEYIYKQLAEGKALSFTTDDKEQADNLVLLFGLVLTDINREQFDVIETGEIMFTATYTVATRNEQ